jgi:hypothetical protein
MASLVITPDPNPLELYPGENRLLGLRITDAAGADVDLTPFDGILLDLRVNGIRRASYSLAGVAANPNLRQLSRGSADRYSVTADPATDRITFVSHGLTVGTRVQIVAGTPPTGLTLNTNYFVVAIPSADTLQLSATSGGSVVDFSTAGAALLLTTPDLPLNRIYCQLHHEDMMLSPPGDITAFLTLVESTAVGYSAGGRRLRREWPIGRLLQGAAPFVTVPTA